MIDAAIDLEVFSDVACPWCYIGRRRLAQALARPGAPPATVRWRAFELQPSLPLEGVEARPYYARKFGGEARVEAMFARVNEVGRGDGIRFDFDAMRRAPNTRLAHRAIQLAQAQGAGDAAAAACFHGHFEAGVDISSLDALLAHLARRELPLDLDALRDRLRRGDGESQVAADEREAAQLGVTGVPFFVANRKLAVSGAQPPEVLARLLAEAG